MLHAACSSLGGDLQLCHESLRHVRRVAVGPCVARVLRCKEAAVPVGFSVGFAVITLRAAMACRHQHPLPSCENCTLTTCVARAWREGSAHPSVSAGRCLRTLNMAKAA